MRPKPIFKFKVLPMNMALLHKQIMRGILCLTLIFGFGLQTAHTADTETVLGISKGELEDRILSVSNDIDIRYHSTTEKTIIRYTTGGGKKESEKMLGRVSLYFPIIEEAIQTKGLPEIIKYIPIIESNLKPDAKSRVGAVGLWQFMKPTAKMYDLQMNRTIDQRKNPIAATDAATDYLAKLYDRFGDWTLAIAAYNCGPGNVRKAIRKSGSKNYWELRQYLPKETRYYIPKLIAAAYLMKYYHVHDLHPAQVSSDLLITSTAKVFQAIDLTTVADQLGMVVDDLLQLNTEYQKGTIPESVSGLDLDIPSSRINDFYAIYQPLVYQQILERAKPKLVEKLVVQKPKERSKIVMARIHTEGLPEKVFSLAEMEEMQQLLISSI